MKQHWSIFALLLFITSCTVQIQIVDAQGKLVQSMNRVANQVAYNLKVSDLAEGFYFVKVVANGLQELGSKSLVVVR